MNDWKRYRMPAEWEPHRGTWLSWPKKPETWPGKLEKIPPVFAQMAQALSLGEEVHICVDGAHEEEKARAFLKDTPVHFHHIPTNDSWMRDYGPIFVVRDTETGRKLAATDWLYNSWGDKYPPFDLDNLVPAALAELRHIPRFEGGMVLEGGSIDVNGEGALLTSESCLLNPNRNPHLSKTEIEERLKTHLGVSQILWLGDGIVGDDTDGHIDDLARFVSPRCIVTVLEDDPLDDNYKPLEDNLNRLSKMRDLNGRPFDIVTMPMPKPIFYDGMRLPASYANFYIGNRVVLLPTYGDPNDAVAKRTLARLFSDRDIVGIDCTDLVWGLGAFHCVTQQEPLIIPRTPRSGG